VISNFKNVGCDEVASFQEVSILFLMVLLGYVMRKKNIITDGFNREIKNYVLDIALPAMIIVSMKLPFSPDLLLDSGILLVISIISYVFIILFSYGIVNILNLKESRRDIFQFVLIFSNVGFMGFPVAHAVFGEVGVFYASIYNLPFNFLIWTLGVHILMRTGAEVDGGNGGSLIKVLLNPGIISVFIGFSLFLFSIDLPYPVFRTLELVGATTTPLAMIFIGASLMKVHYSELTTDKNLLLLSGIRLVFLPGIVYFILRLIGVSGLLLGVPVLITAMPAAANSAIMAAKYGNDGYLGSKAVFITTMLSIATIPIVVFLLTN